MFKRLTTIIAVVMLTLSAGSAFAAFADNELFRVVYDSSNGNEQLSDLGAVSTLLTGGPHTIAPGTLSAGNASNLFVYYFAVDSATARLWVSGSTTSAQVANGNNSFGALAAGNNSPSISSLLASAVKGDASANLAPLANGTATSVTQTLYYINDANTDGTPGIAKATIITSTDTTVITTPIPPAFLLMSSGLVGLFGFRRRLTLSN